MTIGQVILPYILLVVNLCFIFQLIFKIPVPISALAMPFRLFLISIFGFTIVCIPGYIYIKPCSFASAYIGEMSLASRIETTLILPVHADHHDTVGILGQILRTISVVHVPVKN